MPDNSLLVVKRNALELVVVNNITRAGANQPRHVVALLTCVVMISGFACMRSAKKIPPLSREEVATTWVGFTEDESYLLRLWLSSDGSGLVGFIYLDEDPEVSRIKSWDYKPGTAGKAWEWWSNKSSTIQMSTTKENFTFHSLTGTIIGQSMTLKAAGPGWEVMAHLRPEAGLERRWRRLARSMELR